MAGVPSLDPSSTTISSRSSTVWRRTLATAVRRKRSPSFTARRTDTSGAAGVLTGERTIASRLVAEALPTFDLILATVDRAEELDAAPRLARGADLRELQVARRRPERRRPGGRGARGPALRRRAPAVGARTLTRPQRGARSRRRRRRRVPRRRLRLPARPARARRAPLRRRADARRAHRAGGRRGRPLAAIVEVRRRRADGRQPLEPRDLVHDLPSARGRRSGRRVRRSSSASARDGRGRRARRSTTSCAPCGAAHGSPTTPRLR